MVWATYEQLGGPRAEGGVSKVFPILTARRCDVEIPKDGSAAEPSLELRMNQGNRATCVLAGIDE